MSFASQIANFSRQTTLATERDRKAVLFALFRNIIQDTPVDTGRLRGNWQTTVNTPATTPVNRVDPSGTATISSILGNLGNGEGQDVTVWFVNTLPYASRIEYESWSKQAPQGMVRRNLLLFDRLVENMANP